MTDPHDSWAALSRELARHLRGQHQAKARFHALMPQGLDLAAVGMLHHLERQGGCRQGELAGTVQLDPSTVSRYVRQLVEAGYASRAVDPRDGRAVHVTPTDEGRALCERFDAQRRDLISQVTAAWSIEDLDRFTALLQRFNDGLDVVRSATQSTTHTEPSTPRQES